MDKQEYASVLTACFPHTKLLHLHLHLVHLCSHFLVVFTWIRVVSTTFLRWIYCASIRCRLYTYSFTV